MVCRMVTSGQRNVVKRNRGLVEKRSNVEFRCGEGCEGHECQQMNLECTCLGVHYGVPEY